MQVNVVWVLTAVVVVVLGFAVVQGFQIADMNNKISALATKTQTSSTGSLDMSGWTADEKMQYEHHGVLPARASGSSSSGSSMVGSC